MKQLGKRIVIEVATSMLILTLTACHKPQNPLLTANTNQAINFLIKIQQKASEKTGLYNSSDSVYTTCVKNPSHFNNPFSPSAKNPCDAYLQTMVSLAQKATGDQKQFANLTLANLKDSAVVNKLSKPLLDAMINQGF